ncbi:MAG: SgcJ/EcaC family oxidoreductase, partial [Halieaceae bacterium]|nr:SgcJ/EcaC family oxidoreductase [Halieaceae bacterium]
MTEQDIVQLFANWNAALQTGDPDQVIALYAKDAILLPTVSNQVRHNHPEIRDYFVNFLSKQPQGVI